MQGPVTLVTAPAGAGKTLLLALWVAAGRLPGPVVWLSLDADDNDPSRLWTDALAGLRAGGGVPPDGLLATLAPPEPGTVEAFLALLVKGLGELPHPVVVVLDDLHELTDRLTGGLADALTGGQDGARRLVELERTNGFVVPLDPHVPDTPPGRPGQPPRPRQGAAGARAGAASNLQVVPHPQ